MSQPPTKKPKTSNTSSIAATPRRSVSSCTHCRQQKIKCDANTKYPKSCSRCEKMGLFCEIDPNFKPKKGPQHQILTKEIDDLKIKVNYLLRNESILSKVLGESEAGKSILKQLIHLPGVSSGTNVVTPIISDSSNNNAGDTFAMNNTSTLNNENNNTKFSTSVKPPEQAKKNTKIAVHTYLVNDGNLVNQSSPIPTIPEKLRSSISSVLNEKSDSTDNENTNVITNETNEEISNTLNGNTIPIPTLIPLPVTSSLKEGINGITVDNVNSNNLVQTVKGMAKVPNNIEHIDKLKYTSKSKSSDDITLNKPHFIATTKTTIPIKSPFEVDFDKIDEFVIGDVHISLDKATQLHQTFVRDYLPFLPILFTDSVMALYSQSRLLFWVIMLTACLSDPEPSLYLRLSSLIKQLAIETCWIRTPRSTHISQALLILAFWPLPNQKILDDSSYRFVSLAKSLSYQLGLHRGEFISEFTRNQKTLLNAEKWRTRTWLGIYFAEVCWASILGLPPTSQTDYLVECARTAIVKEDSKVIDEVENLPSFGAKATKLTLPSRFKKLMILSIFQRKICSIMGSSVISSDGLIEPKDRASSLALLERELDIINKDEDFEKDIVVHIYYLYTRLMVCCFAFLPQTPLDDQAQYVPKAYLYSTECVTLLSKLVSTSLLNSLPVYVRQAGSYASLILFKLQVSPMLVDKYLDSTRQSIVTVHRLYRNQLGAWLSAVENDISRTASMLEKLNMILITHPDVFTEGKGIITRIRSHLIGSLFYDFVWCVSEARRREMDPSYKTNPVMTAPLTRKLYPLPLYDQIVKEDFQTVTKTSPGGTTITTLIPTKNAMDNAKEIAKSNDKLNGTVVSINGIPLKMLDETGSLDVDKYLFDNGINLSNKNVTKNGTGNDEVNNSASNNIAVTTEVRKDDSNVYEIQVDNNQKNLINNVPDSNNETRKKNNTPSLFDNRNSPYAKVVSRMSTPDQALANMQTARNTAKDNSNATFVTNGNSISNNTSRNVSSLNLLNQKSNRPSNEVVSENNNNISRNSIDTNPNGNMNNIYNRDMPNDLTDFFQQQSIGWTEGNINTDDLFGWFDNVNSETNF